MSYSATTPKKTLISKKIFANLSSSCYSSDETEVAEHVTRQKRIIIKEHERSTYPIKAPGETGGNKKYWMTKLDPKDRNHCMPIYGKSREEVEDKVIAYILKIQDEAKLTVRDAIIEALGGEDIKNTKTVLKTGRRTYLRYLKHLDSNIGDIPLSKLNEAAVRSALDAVLKERLTEKEFNQVVGIFNKLADYCAYEHIEVCNLKTMVSTWRKAKTTGKHVFAQAKAKSADQAFNRTEAATIIKWAFANPSPKSLCVALMITTGLRIGEALALEARDVNFNKRYIWIERSEDTKTYEVRDYTKTNYAKEVYLTDLAANVLREALALGGKKRIFENKNSNDGLLHCRAVDDFLRETVHKKVLGLDDTVEARSCHDCRRTYASLEYLNGTDIYTIQQQLRHTKVDQTWDYIRNVVDASERCAKLAGIGVSLKDIHPEKGDKIAVYADYTQKKNNFGITDNKKAR